MSVNPRYRLACSLVCCVIAIGGCGKSGDKKTATQVAAKVNGDEITVHQINQALARAGRLTPEQTKAASRQVLEQLIDQQLLIQQSVAKRLDRDPDVVNAMEASRRQILSQAYIEKWVVAGAAKPGPEEVKKFYDARPELFSQRRIYRLQQLAINLGANQAPALRTEMEKSRNLNDIAAWLRKNNIAFNASSAARAAEQLPLDSLPRLSSMKDGDISAFQIEGRVTIVQLVASQQAPLNEKEATPFIEQFLLNQRRSELATAEMKQLRQTAKLEYHGDFGKDGAPAAAVVPPTPGMPAAAEKKDPGVFDKGLKGLR